MSSLITTPLPVRVPEVKPVIPGMLSEPQAQDNSSSFSNMLQGAVQQVNQLQTTADRAAELVSSGQLQDLHVATIAMQKASLALDLTIQVRNKAIEAYQEIMRMQI